MAKNDSETESAIPLDQIWALHMPGTRDILELDREWKKQQEVSAGHDDKSTEKPSGLIEPIVNALMADVSPNWPREGQTAMAGFAVSGVGVDALREASDVMAGGTAAQTSFPENNPISLVFFSFEMGLYVDLQSVERRDNKIELRYRLVQPVTKSLANQFALIPIDQLPPGDYQVSIVQLPGGQELLDRTHASVKGNDWSTKRDKEVGERFICRPFGFSVVTGKDNPN